MKFYFLLVSLTSMFQVTWSQVIKVTTQEYPLPGTLTDDTLYYSFIRKLRWSDFTGKVRSASPSAALTFTGFSYHATTITKKDTIYIDIYLQVYFVRSGSWVRHEEKNSYALAHEQTHFDIAKLAAEEFKDSLHLKPFSPEYHEIEIHFLYWDYWRKMHDTQESFDEETRHGSNRMQEAIWERKIKNALKPDQ